ncbi:hypothetical protein TrispH2_009960 [Trichoplax sp. H2]|nr:hypothetical protein TrispH2_009960 [Trichoplax sp. H2]|eukprot:RDD38325.1 hypothetical protein TrispH2_009960 [Trichoplax sp. H2]
MSSLRARKQIDYSKFDVVEDASDDDFQETSQGKKTKSTSRKGKEKKETLSKNATPATNNLASPNKPRLSRSEKMFQRDLEAAIKASQDSTGESKNESGELVSENLEDDEEAAADSVHEDEAKEEEESEEGEESDESEVKPVKKGRKRAATAAASTPGRPRRQAAVKKSKKQIESEDEEDDDDDESAFSAEEEEEDEDDEDSSNSSDISEEFVLQPKGSKKKTPATTKKGKKAAATNNKRQKVTPRKAKPAVKKTASPRKINLDKIKPNRPRPRWNVTVVNKADNTPGKKGRSIGKSGRKSLGMSRSSSTSNSGLGSTPLPSPGSVASPSAAVVRVGLSKKQSVKPLHPSANNSK